MVPTINNAEIVIGVDGKGWALFSTNDLFKNGLKNANLNFIIVHEL